VKVGSASDKEEVEAALRCRRSSSDEEAEREWACLENSSFIGEVIDGFLPRYFISSALECQSRLTARMALTRLSETVSLGI
jgi:hypothetical protein